MSDKTTDTTKKPLARLTLTVDFCEVTEQAAIKELIEAVKLYGEVTRADFKVLRAHKVAVL